MANETRTQSQRAHLEVGDAVLSVVQADSQSMSISDLASWEVQCCSPTVLEATAMQGQLATLCLDSPTDVTGQLANSVNGSSSSPVRWPGLVASVTALGHTADGYHYRIALANPLTRLQSTRMMHTTVDTPLDKAWQPILAAALPSSVTIAWQLQHDAPIWPFHLHSDTCALDALQHQWRHAGWCYRFVDVDGTPTLQITDDVAQWQAGQVSDLTVIPLSMPSPAHSRITHFAAQQYARPTSVRVQAANPQTPLTPLIATANSALIDAPLGDVYDTGVFADSLAMTQQLAQRHMQAIDVFRNPYRFTTDDPHLQLGDVLTVHDAPFTTIPLAVRVVHLSHQYQTGEALKPIDTPLAAGQSPVVDNRTQSPHTHHADTPWLTQVLSTASPHTGPGYRATVVAIADTQTYAPLPRPLSDDTGLRAARVDADTVDDNGQYPVRLMGDTTNHPPGAASAPVSLMQPASGPNSGWHAPITHQAEVVLHGLEDAPQAFVMLGHLPHPEHPSPVNNHNATTHQLTTATGHNLSLDDKLQREQVQLTSADAQHQLTLQADPIAPAVQLSTQGDMNLMAGLTHTVHSGNNQIHQSDANHHITVEHDSTVNTGVGPIVQTAGQDHLNQAQQHITHTTTEGDISQLAGDTLLHQANQQVQLTAEQGPITLSTPDGDITLDGAKSITLNAPGIVLTQGKGQLTLNDAAWHYQGPRIDISAPLINIGGSKSQLGGSYSAKQPHPSLVTHTIKLSYKTDAGLPIANAYYTVTFDDNTQQSGQLDAHGKATLTNVPNQPYTVTYSTEQASDTQQPNTDFLNATLQDQRQQLATLAQSLEQQMLQAAQGREQAYNDSSLTQQMLINIGAEMVGVWDSAKAIPQSIQMLGHIDLIPEKVAQLMTVLHDPQMRQTLETLATQYFHDSLYTEADDFHAAGEVYGGVLMAAILKQVGPGLASLIGSATQRFFALLAMQRFDALADAVGTVQAPFEQLFQLIQKTNKTIKRKLGWQRDEGAAGESLTTVENKADSYLMRGRYTTPKEIAQFLKQQGLNKELRREVLESFEYKSSRLKQAGENEFGTRYYDDIHAYAKGRYLFRTFPATRKDLALKSAWNQMSSLKQWKIRPNAWIIEGPAADQGLGYEGGQMQKYILDPENDLMEP